MYAINNHHLHTAETASLLSSWVACTTTVTGWEVSTTHGSHFQTGHAVTGTLLDVDRSDGGGFRLTIAVKAHREPVTFTIQSADSLKRCGIELAYTIKGA